MLKKLRLKFICITMAIVTVMLCVIFGLVQELMSESLFREDERFLKAVEAGREEHPKKPNDAHPENKPERPNDGRPENDQDEQPKLPKPGEFEQPHFELKYGLTSVEIVSGDDYFDLTDQAYLESIYAAAKNTGEATGILPQYGLQYYRMGGLQGGHILFLDVSAEHQMLQNLQLICLMIGILIFLAFFGISILLARWVTKPVEKAWNEQRQFVADASHELKTPLTVILTNTELLAQEQDEARRQQFTQNIQATSHRMRYLVEGLLELARVDNGALKKSFEKVELTQLVSDTALPMEAMLFEAGLELDMQLAPGLFVMGNASYLQQAVTVLLDNARKYAQPGSRVTLHLTKDCCRECRLQVENLGEPIAPEDLQNIFKRFYRVDQARTGGAGYGLGLPIAKAIVEDHGGKIWATSEQGINTFYIKLPTV